VTLEDENPTIFSIFLAYIVSGDVQNATEYIQSGGNTDGATSDEELMDMADKHFEQLHKCYVLGDKLQAEGFRNTIMDLIISAATRNQADSRLTYLSGTASEDINYVFSNTPVNSPLCRMILDRIYDVSNTDDDQMKYLELPGVGVFYYRLFEWAMTEESCAPWERDRYYYHDHSDQPDTYSCTDESKPNPKANVKKF